MHWIALNWIALIALHCIELHYCIALHWLHCIALHYDMFGIFFAGFAEISQWPLDFITRFHVHVLRNAFTFAFAYDMFGVFCEICRNQSMAPGFCYSDSCTCGRQHDTHTSRHTARQQERQTDKQKHWYMSHPFSLFPFHAKPGLTRLTRVSLGTECMSSCVCPVQKLIILLRVCVWYFSCPRELFLRCHIVFLICFLNIN